MHHDINLFMHHIDYYFYFFCANLQSALGFFLFIIFGLVFVSCPYFNTMPRKTRARRTASSSFEPTFQSELFWSEKNKALYESLNIKRKIWAERLVLIDELDPAIKVNFERRG